jgi:hypothetical protein
VLPATRASLLLAPLLVLSCLEGAACQPAGGGQAPPVAPTQPPPGYPPPVAYGYPPPGYPQPAPAPQPGPQPPPAPAAPIRPRPMLAPLVGSLAWQAEARAVIQELVAHLPAQNQVRVATVPLVIDPNPGDVNAFASCDDGGAPFVAATEGLLEALDAIAQTKATDELYGTRTYDAYTSAVVPRLVTAQNASAMLPAGVVPPQYWADPRRVSRAHEIFDELVAFTFGHELAHHYLGHTGCANGQAVGLGPALVQIEQMALQVPVLRWVNQPNEAIADTNGCINTLDTGRARATQAYRWTEEGGLWLLDFFARLEVASGANPLLGFLRTHPNPGGRIFLVQTTASAWHLQHPD